MATDDTPLEVRTPWNPPPSCQCRSIKTTTVATAEEGLYIETVEKFICVLHRPEPEDLPLPTESFLADLHSSTPSSASPPPPPPPSTSTPPSSASPQPPSHTGWKKYRRSDEEAKEEYDKVLRERNLSGRTLTINGGELSVNEGSVQEGRNVLQRGGEQEPAGGASHTRSGDRPGQAEETLNFVF